jgi:hypothetical protein
MIPRLFGSIGFPRCNWRSYLTILYQFTEVSLGCLREHKAKILWKALRLKSTWDLYCRLLLLGRVYICIRAKSAEKYKAETRAKST